VLDHPQTRADYEDITPAILVESPTPGGRVSGNTLRITGTANTFEATFSAKVTDASGQTLVEQVIHATSGSGTRGTFDATLTLTLTPTQASQGTLTVYESSAKDGSPQNVVEIPITFGS
jgi:germination protein M